MTSTNSAPQGASTSLSTLDQSLNRFHSEWQTTVVRNETVQAAALEVAMNTNCEVRAVNEEVTQIGRLVALIDRSPSQLWQWAVSIVVGVVVTLLLYFIDFSVVKTTTQVVGDVTMVTTGGWTDPFFGNWLFSAIVGFFVLSLVAYVPHWPKIEEDEGIDDEITVTDAEINDPTDRTDPDAQTEQLPPAPEGDAAETTDE